MSTGQCSRCRATYACICSGPQSTGANYRTAYDPMGALQSVVHEQSEQIRSLLAALDEALAAVQRIRGSLKQMGEMDGIGSESLRYWAGRITYELDGGR
jgi:hypothetical protein